VLKTKDFEQECLHFLGLFGFVTAEMKMLDILDVL